MAASIEEAVEMSSMMTSPLLGDGSWELRVLVTDLQVERTIRVKGDLHLGGVMLKLVDELDIAMDWSDHAMWWPEKNIWLDKTRWTLDRYSITADALIHFTPMHKTLRIQLPDLRYIDSNVDFSTKTFNTVIAACSELEIRHPEELSFAKPVESEHLKFNYGDFKRQEEKRRRVTLGAMPPNSHAGQNGLNGHRSHTASMLDVTVNDRPDTNTYAATLGRKVSTLSWSAGMGNGNGHHTATGTAPSTPSRFRSLGRGANFLSSSRRKSEGVQHRGATTPTFGRQTPTNGTFRGNGSHSPYFNGNGNGNGNGIHHNGSTNGFHHHNNGSGNNGTMRSSFGASASSMTPGFPGGSGSAWSLAVSPPPSDEARYSIVRPKNLAERARMNVGWLDSSLSLMEQGIRDFDTLLLRFKFHSFYDLNAKSDPVRINLIFEQAKWQLLNEEIDCTEEEMMLFAALQLQVGLQANVPQPNDDDGEDDVDAALTDLQIALEGGSASAVNGNGNGFNGFDAITVVPALTGHLRYLRPRKFTLKGYKRHFFVLRELQLTAYRTEEAMASMASAALSVTLKGCEIAPDVNIAQDKYGIKLSVPSQDGMSELWIKCENELQYAQWMAAFRLAAKGKTMADSGYNSEVKSIQAFLSMQHPACQPVINPATLDIQIEEYVAPRFFRKMRSKLRHKMLEAHTNVKDLNLLEAKMNFIKAWQSLPDYGVTLFVARFLGEKRDELIGIAFNRLMRMNLHSGDHIKTWRFNTIKAWNINWETKHMMIQLGDGKNVIFKTLSAECKVVHEFIGGYIFLSMRTKDGNQQLDQQLFHKLTGGWQ